ncbi:MAG: tail fiber domain-containing protein [Bacteroidota bacterium]
MIKNFVFSTGLVLLSGCIFSQGQFKIRNDEFIQIGYSSRKALTFGQGTAPQNNGNFALEYCAGCPSPGFNIWKPYPTAGAANYLLYIRDNGNTGIGNSGDASAKLWVSGNLRVNATIYPSDLRYSQNTKNISKQLDNLLQLKPVQYSYIQSRQTQSDSLSVNVLKEKGNDYNFDQQLHFGIFAQDIEKIYPNLVSKDEQGVLGVNYAEFIPLLVGAIQEQQEKILELEREIEKLKK